MDDKLNLPIREKMQIRVFQHIVEGKRERNVPFVGVVRKVRGSGVNKTITVSQMLEGVEVEKIFPLALPTITKVELIEEKPKVRHTKSGAGFTTSKKSKTSNKATKAKSIASSKARSAKKK